jgi:hypothetical protein
LSFFFGSVVKCRIGDIKMGARWGEGVDLPRAEVPFGLVIRVSGSVKSDCN